MVHYFIEKYKGKRTMNTLFLENSPIAYHIDTAANTEWVCFLHAAFVNSDMFKTQFDYFKGKYNLLAIDILGHGKSLNATKSDSIEKMSDWINQIFIKHKISAAHFVGVSLGSVFIQDFANKYDEKVLSLACFGGYNINDFDFKRQKANSKGQMKMMLKAMFSVKWFAKENKKISAYTEQAKDEFYKLNIQFNKKSFIYLAKLNKFINRFPIKKRCYPLLIGCGEFDIPMELEIVNEWAAKENCQHAIIQEAGHCCNMDNSKTFNSILEKFWSQRQ